MKLKTVHVHGPAAALLAVCLIGCQNRSTDPADGASNENRAAENEDSPTVAAKNEDDRNSGSPADRTPFEGSGKALFPVTEHDFGEVEQGESVSHVFKVQNASEEVLHIKRVRGS